MSNKNSLIIFFSRAGENWAVGNISVGNTEHLANFIHDITGAELHKIEPVNKYPDEYKKCTEVAKEEYNKKLRPELKNALTDIKQYEIIYIGYPIWWGTFPMPMFTQLEKLDFKGKIVMPFSTNEGSGLGNSISDIKKCCVGANVKHALSITGSKAKDSKNEVEKWIKSNLK